MRIAYVVSDSSIPVFGCKGACVHVREMVNAFAALGHDVTVLAASRGGPATALDASVVEADGAGWTDTGAAFSADPAQKTWAKERHAMQVSRAHEEELLRRARRTGFDLVYERYTLFGTGGLAAARRLAVPYVVEVNSPLLLEQQQYRALHHVAQAEANEAEVLGGADAVLAVSREVRRYVLSKGARPERTHLVPNGVDLARFNPDVEPCPIAGPAQEFVVGFTGSLKPWHGIDVLMDAFRVLAARCDDYRLLIVGDGPLRSWIDGYARGADLSGRVSVTGWISHDALPGLIKAMDVAAAPYPRMEGFYFSPLKIYEYLAVGKPVVASDVGQVGEAIEDGVTGLLAAPGDARGLAERIERLRLSDELRRTMGDRAARAAALHGWRDNARRVVDLIGPLVTAA